MLERTLTMGVDLNNAAHEASTRTDEAGRMIRTILTCRGPHPNAGAAAVRRFHGARLGVAHGVWVPTGRVIDSRTADTHPFEELPDDQRILVWCQGCKHATEYEKSVPMEGVA